MDPDLLALLGLVIISGFFSASETALIAITPSKVDELVDQKVPNAQVLKKLKKDPHRVLITVLVANNVINIGASAYAAVVFTEKFGSSGVGIATGFMTFLILVFGEIAPKSFAHEHSARIAVFIARPIQIIQTILFPVVWLFEKVVDIVNKLTGTKKTYTVTEGELMAMVKIGAQEGSIEKSERDLIENVLEFNDIQVEEVMTPRVNIEALDCEMSLKEAVDYAIAHSHSRLPIYRKTIDNIIGMIMVKNLLKAYHESPPNKKIKSIKFAKPLTVPLSKKINQLFREFQRKHMHLAIVIDEHGGTAGLVTLEDLLEEIVGEIVDEFDTTEKPIEIIDEDTIITDGNALIEDISDFFKIELSNKEHYTISTFITETLERFPREGETVDLPRVTITIIRMDNHLVSKVKIQKKELPPEDDDE